MSSSENKFNMPNNQDLQGWDSQNFLINESIMSFKAKLDYILNKLFFIPSLTVLKHQVM